ncbi:MAG: cation:proton antiporter [Candidatus Syntrophonatronum acetioxidans]|uniref:Cation:proton antiporter n=1 Tax=Candidatus Syntrophonatronum acetioxidans TaxID=1795816 RepID=A0A424YBC9_9FIRM|nr:MAG: cation:proton antiporter [Candidatus Syntrophonatronum acetioxidans]
MLLTAFTVACILLVIMTFLCLYRAYVGPTVADRVISINVISTKAIVIMVLVSIIFHKEYFLDIALVYSLIAFLATIAVAKYLQRGVLE